MRGDSEKSLLVQAISWGGMRCEVSVVLLLKISYEQACYVQGLRHGGLFYWEGINQMKMTTEEAFVKVLQRHG